MVLDCLKDRMVWLRSHDETEVAYLDLKTKLDRAENELLELEDDYQHVKCKFDALTRYVIIERKLYALWFQECDSKFTQSKGEKLLVAHRFYADQEWEFANERHEHSYHDYLYLLPSGWFEHVEVTRTHAFVYEEGLFHTELEPTTSSCEMNAVGAARLLSKDDGYGEFVFDNDLLRSDETTGKVDSIVFLPTFYGGFPS
jgi:hypothetical protein